MVSNYLKKFPTIIESTRIKFKKAQVNGLVEFTPHISPYAHTILVSNIVQFIEYIPTLHYINTNGVCAVCNVRSVHTQNLTCMVQNDRIRTILINLVCKFSKSGGRRLIHDLINQRKLKLINV